ncbi:cytochrome P450 [Favolaschia claudopus]|uniref:Cytochrome P450 n=1 Tax=Favolaschia claudopus TaxID=2862362 RepID=A0AAV9ZVV2_9AGAR
MRSDSDECARGSASSFLTRANTITSLSAFRHPFLPLDHQLSNPHPPTRCPAAAAANVDYPFSAQTAPRVASVNFFEFHICRPAVSTSITRHLTLSSVPIHAHNFLSLSRSLPPARAIPSRVHSLRAAGTDVYILTEKYTNQIPAFFFAGHETSSSALAWALQALSEKIDVQNKLREELLTVSTDNPGMDELNALPYLEIVVREILRVQSPVLSTERVATEDDVLPLSEPYVGKDGKSHESIPIRKGQTIHIPILAVNTDTSIWGEDALQFRPERWQNIPEAAAGIPNIWGNLLTFFAGPHNCIGFRFSVIEIKAILFILIRAFEFEAGVSSDSIGRAATGTVQKPVVLGNENGSGLPLIVKIYDV